jgi:hypothetical protein
VPGPQAMHPNQHSKTLATYYFLTRNRTGKLQRCVVCVIVAAKACKSNSLRCFLLFARVNSLDPSGRRVLSDFLTVSQKARSQKEFRKFSSNCRNCREFTCGAQNRNSHERNFLQPRDESVPTFSGKSLHRYPVR